MLVDLLRDPIKLIEVVGLIGIIFIVFAETGLFFGFFLPGDSLLITAGLFAARGDLNLLVLLTTVILAAIIGDALGFHIGKYLGPRLYEKKDSFFFRRKHLQEATAFYEKHGGMAIIVSRFVPIIRTFAPTVAGAAKMNYSKFILYNIIGAFLWVLSMCLSGYYLGQMFGDKINSYIHYLIFGVIVLSFLPIIIKYFQLKRQKKNLL